MSHKPFESLEASHDVSVSLDLDYQPQNSLPKYAYPTSTSMHGQPTNDLIPRSDGLVASFGDDKHPGDDTSFLAGYNTNTSITSVFDYDDLAFQNLTAPPISSTTSCTETTPYDSLTSCSRVSHQPQAGTEGHESPSNHSLVDFYSSNSLPREYPSHPARTTAGSGWLSPLHMAAQKGQDRIVHALLQHNVDLNEPDSDGLSPIVHAIIGGHEDVVSLLLLHGARILGDLIEGKHHDGYRCSQPSALHWTVHYRREALLRVLLKHSRAEHTSIDVYDAFGRTPLHLAIDTNFEAGVLMLLQFGADPKFKARNFGRVRARISMGSNEEFEPSV
ncbi:MAG: hypothetical protein Q9183_000588 [Haloplaca sp. 2 TL-2023]